MKNSEILEQLKKDRIVLLSNVKECIINNSDSFGVSAEKVYEILNEEEKASKKMETIINIKEYINELAIKIVNAKDENEIIEIRKELNKNINKVKNEMLKRNITEETLVDYQEKVKYLRKDISRLIRYHKRIEKFNRIEELNNKQSLSEDETIELKKLIHNEKNYNKRNIKNYVTQDSKQIKKDNIPDIKKTNKTFSYEEFIESFFEATTKRYDRQYEITPIMEYTNSRLKNVHIFLKNILTCKNNNKKIKAINYDLVHFYNGDDLIAYMEYVKNKNSLMHGLRSIFSKTYLSSNYSKNLNSYNRCSEWLKNFYIFNGIELPKEKVKTI